MPKPFIYDTDKILALLNDPEGTGYATFGDVQCEYVGPLEGSGTVSMYADAGDVVASNPSGDMGVKIIGTSGSNTSECYDLFTDALSIVTPTSEFEA